MLCFGVHSTSSCHVINAAIKGEAYSIRCTMRGVRRCLCVDASHHSHSAMPLGMHRLKKVYQRARNPPSDSTVVTLAVDKGELAAIASHIGAAPSKTGVLLKYTNVVKGWKKRLFVLENGVLIYGAAEEDERLVNSSTPTCPQPASLLCQSSRGSVERHDEATPVLHSQSAPAAVTIASASPLSAASSAPARHQQSLATGTSSSADSAHPDAALLSHPHHASQSAAVTTYKRPKARLRAKRRLLRRYGSKDERERDIKGTINLQFAVISADDSDSLRFAIDVGHDIYHCRTETPQERDEWVAVLNESNSYFKGLIKSAAMRAKERPSSPSQSQATNGKSSLPAMDRESRSEESDESVLEDDGLQEAEESRKALIEELRHVVDFWRHKWVDQNGSIDVGTEAQFVRTLANAFSSDRERSRVRKDVPARETAKALLDLSAWCLHVLRTNDEMYDRRLKADLARMMGRGVPVFPQGTPTNDPKTWNRTYQENGYDDDEYDDESDGDLQFFDALSRSASMHSAVSPVHMLSAELDETPGVSLDAQGSLLPSMAVMPKQIRSSRLARVKTANLRSIDGARAQLPPLKGPKEKLNIWGILKDSVGKDLSKISIPVVLNEPLSFVQRLAEDVEYSELFDQAAEEKDPYARMMYVATAIISHYSSTPGRVGKPFNPLLGETYELVLPNKGKGLRFIAEQVSHHPPISACYAEGTGGSWKYYNALEIKNKFWGKSLEIFPTGLNHVEIPEYGDHYVFEQVTTCVHNIVVGRMWLDNYGDIEIVNRGNGVRCSVKFNKTGWMSDRGSFAAIKAIVTDENGVEKLKIGGNWTERVYQELGRGRQKELWTVAERPPAEASNMYNWTKWAITLNEPVAEHLVSDVAPTDSRFRPDQRALEDGENERANVHKGLLEEGQRDRRRQRELDGEDWTPQWFTKVTDDILGRDYYKFTGEYFHCKNNRDWSRCPDIYSCATESDEQRY